MGKPRSVAYVADAGAQMPFFYQKTNPDTGLPFDSAAITAVAIAVYDVADGSVLQASTGMAYDATLKIYRYLWTYAGAARRVMAVMTPTRAAGISAALTPVEYEPVDLADTLARIGKNSEAATDPSAASGTLMSKVRGVGVDADASFAELQAIEGAGWSAALDNLHQAKLARDGISNQVSALDLRQSTNFIVPQRMAPSKTYVARLRIFDDAGNPEAPTATPVISTLEGAITGVTIGSVTADGGTGLYKFNVVLDGTADPGTTFTLLAQWTSPTEGASEATRLVEIDAFDAINDQMLSDLATILARMGLSTDVAGTATLFGRHQRSYDQLIHGTWGLQAIHTIVADIQTKIGHGTYGLAALNTDLDALIAALGVDGAVTLHQKFGAFTAAYNLFALLGVFTPTNTVMENLRRIQGQL